LKWKRCPATGAGPSGYAACEVADRCLPSVRSHHQTVICLPASGPEAEESRP
jgi:hypothetical protein